MILAALPYPQIDPVLVHLGPLPIRWYALAYIAGLLLGWWGIILILRRKQLWAAPPFNGKTPATEDQIGDLVVWMTFGVIIGGRLGWDLIYGVILCSVSPYADFCRGMPMEFVVNPIKIIPKRDQIYVFCGVRFKTVARATMRKCPVQMMRFKTNRRPFLRITRSIPQPNQIS